MSSNLKSFKTRTVKTDIASDLMINKYVNTENNNKITQKPNEITGLTHISCGHTHFHSYGVCGIDAFTVNSNECPVYADRERGNKNKENELPSNCISYVGGWIVRLNNELTTCNRLVRHTNRLKLLLFFFVYLFV